MVAAAGANADLGGGGKVCPGTARLSLDRYVPAVMGKLLQTLLIKQNSRGQHLRPRRMASTNHPAYDSRTDSYITATSGIGGNTKEGSLEESGLGSNTNGIHESYCERRQSAKACQLLEAILEC